MLIFLKNIWIMFIHKNQLKICTPLFNQCTEAVTTFNLGNVWKYVRKVSLHVFGCIFLYDLSLN